MSVDDPGLIAIGEIRVTARPTTVGARSNTFVFGVELDIDTEIAVAAIEEGTVVPNGNVTVIVPP
jgi:hypothetical protein